MRFLMPSMIIRLPQYKLIIPAINNTYKRHNSDNYIKACDNNVKKACHDLRDQNGEKFRYSQTINSETSKNKFNSTINGADVYKPGDNKHLKNTNDINSNDIPIITSYMFLYETLFTFNNGNNSPLNLIKKTHSISDGHGHELNPGAEKDLEKISSIWYKLLDALIYKPGDNKHLKNTNDINADDIPIINYYGFLLEALFTSNNGKNSPLNLIKKIHNIYNGHKLHPGAEKDLEKISRIWYKLLNLHVNCWIIEMSDEKGSIRYVRNLLAHDNCLCLLNSNAWNCSLYEQLKINFNPDVQKKLDQHYLNGDWILWNLYDGNVKFLCIISNDGLNMAIDQFQNECMKIIRRSRENESENDSAKKINDNVLARLIKHIHHADISNKFPS